MNSEDYLESLRQSAIKQSTETKSNSRDHEWVPTNTPTRVRILPIPSQDGKPRYPYMTHSFHYIVGGREDGKDVKLFVPKKVVKDGVSVDDPIDAFVAKLYAMKTPAEKEIAGALKRKRNFYFNALVYEDGKDVQLKTIIDSSSDGKLAQRVCSIMGLPFCKDIEDRWFPQKDFVFDPDKAYYNLIDPSAGYDLKVKKSVTGNNPWDFNYNESFPIMKAPRALGDLEINLMKAAPNLDTYVAYETNYYKVKEILDRYVGNLSGGAPAPKSSTPQHQAPSAPSYEDDSDISEEDLRNQLLD